jgi:UDP:flavonoid glycosyltransferase YjiC (YdhE family)
LIPLFSPATGTWGGLTRVIAMADAAQKAGHVVAFCASGYLEDELRRRGYLVHSMPIATMLGLPPSLSRGIERRSQHMTLPVKPGKSIGNIWFVLMLSGLARTSYLKRLVDAEIQAARRLQADALFTDLDPGAFLLSIITNLPLASAYASIMSTGIGSLPWKLVSLAENAVLRKYGIPESTCDEICFAPSILKIIPSIPELDDTDPSRADVLFVGHLLGDIRKPDSFIPEPGKRYVFAYSGIGSMSLDILKAILPQVFPADGNIVCLVGAQSVSAPFRLGAVEFRPYVPAEKVLPYCDWTICHGGQNTIIQSLRANVPLLIFPGAIFERRFNARKVQEAGAGLMGESNEFTGDWLKSALKTQAACARNAQRLGERIRSFGGAPVAVWAIERWLEKGS